MPESVPVATQAVREPGDDARWQCPNCGQTAFGKVPPELCDFCGDFTTWRSLPLAEP